MPYTTSVAGTTITASWANTNLRDQVITPFATTTARDAAITSPIEGMVSYQADNDRLTCYNGAAWVDALQLGAWFTYTPTLTQGVTVSKTVTMAKYCRFGKTVMCLGNLSITSAGTSSSAVVVGLPVATAASGYYIGNFNYSDVSGPIIYCGQAVLTGTSTIAGVRDSAPAAAQIGNSPVFAAASGDLVEWSVFYEAAAQT